MELHQRLVELRKSNNLSQEELAEKIYVSRQTISNWERGKTYPDIQSLLLIVTVFNTSLDYLIRGDIEIMESKFSVNHLVRLGLLLGSLLILGFIGNALRTWHSEHSKTIVYAVLLAVLELIFHSVRRLEKEHLMTYHGIIDFIHHREIRPVTLGHRIMTITMFIILMCLMISLGAAVSSFLFY